MLHDKLQPNYRSPNETTPDTCRNSKVILTIPLIFSKLSSNNLFKNNDTILQLFIVFKYYYVFKENKTVLAKHHSSSSHQKPLIILFIDEWMIDNPSVRMQNFEFGMRNLICGIRDIPRMRPTIDKELPQKIRDTNMSGGPLMSHWTEKQALIAFGYFIQCVQIFEI